MPGCAPLASVSFAASIYSTQCSPPCRAVLVDRVNAAPEAGCDSATPPDTSKASAKAPAAASTNSLNTTSRSPSGRQPLAPSAGVVETRIGSGLLQLRSAELIEGKAGVRQRRL